MTNRQHSTICFTVFNPFCLLHYPIAITQLLKGKRYWWVVHCAHLIDGSTLEVRLFHAYLTPYKPSSMIRELYYSPMVANHTQIALLLSKKYFINCSRLTLALCGTEAVEYPSPAGVYARARAYTRRLNELGGANETA